MKKTFKIKGMHCNSCSQLIENELKDKVNNIAVSYANENAIIEFNEKKITEQQIKEKIKKLGYEIVENNPKSKWKLFSWILFIAVILLFLYSLFIGFDFSMGVKMPQIGENANLILLFGVGLLTGFHCMSMCGGFIVSYTTKNALKGHKSFTQHLVYGIAKTFSYALIGGLFGLIGGFISFNTQIRSWVAILAGIFMVFYALSMFGLKFFRKFQINPKFLSKAASNTPTNPYLGPFFTGLLTGLFIACGPLQAMYLYAIGSGSFKTGAISLAVFGLGTLPVLFGFGSLVTIISHKTTSRILKISAMLILILGLIMINTGLALTGSSYDLQSLKTKLIGSNNNAVISNGIQEINMTIDGTNWYPKVFVLKKDIPTKWIIDAKKLPCDTEIYVNDYNLDIKLKTGINIIEFTPNKTGTIKWACWMGMISGNFIVTDTGKATSEEINSATPTCTGMCNSSSTP
jgi:sulfite exporter TauE/SafE/copper chaperone CopZ